MSTIPLQGMLKSRKYGRPLLSHQTKRPPLDMSLELPGTTSSDSDGEGGGGVNQVPDFEITITVPARGFAIGSPALEKRSAGKRLWLGKASPLLRIYVL